MQSSTPPLSQVLSFLLTTFVSFSWSRPVLNSCCFMLTHVGVVLTCIDSSWLVSDSCWFVLTCVGLMLIRVDSCVGLVLICVDSCWLVSDSFWPVLIRVELCWYSCIRIDLIFPLLHFGIFNTIKKLTLIFNELAIKTSFIINLVIKSN